MDATDVLTTDIRTATVDRPVGASPGSLAFHAGFMASGLGWHGSLPTFRSTASDQYSHLLEACR
jgi:hypothetical protein